MSNLPLTNTGYLGKERHPRDWQLGSISGDDFPIIRLNGDWREFVPKGEHQGQSMGCVAHSMCNVLEMHALASGLGDFNFSDRYLAEMSGTTQIGNSFWPVWMSARKYGLVSEERWPSPAGLDFNTYYRDIPIEIIEEGIAFAKRYDIQMRWIEEDIESMEFALMSTPLWVASLGHAYTIIARGDGGWITFDSFSGPDGSFVGFHPDDRLFSGIAQVRLIPQAGLMPPTLPEECLVFEAQGIGRWGLHVKGKLYVDDLPKLEGQWMLRNRDSVTDKFMGGPMKPITTEMFDSFPHYNLKNENLN
jgi:hypothetical protein